MTRDNNGQMEEVLRESAQLQALSARLNSATSAEALVHEAIVPIVASDANTVLLFAIFADRSGRPEAIELLCGWNASGPDLIAEGMRIDLAEYPGSKRWMEEPVAPMLIEHVETSDLLDETARAGYEGIGAAAAAIIPLRLGERWVGLLNISWPEPRTFSEADRRTFQLLAQQMAVTLNSQLLLKEMEQRAEALAAVAEVSTAVTTVLDVDQLLPMVVERTKESFNLYHAHVYLLDEFSENLVLAAGCGEAGRKMVAQGHSIPFLHEHSLVARTARTGEAAIVNDVRSEPDFLPNPLLPETRSEMAVPIIVGGLVLGVLDVQAAHTNYFSEINAQVMSTLAGQIAVALHNARQFAEIRQRSLELEETTALMDAVVDNMPVMLFMKEAEELRFVRWNKAAEEITGFPGTQMLGKNDHDFFPAEQADFFNLKDREVLSGKIPVDIPEEPIDTAHRGRRILHTRKVPILDINGEPRYLLGISEDITEQKEREEALSRQAAELDALNRRLTGEGWQRYRQLKPQPLHMTYEGPATERDGENGRAALVQQLEVRGELVGELKLDAPHVLPDEAQGIIEAVAERLSLHVDNLRLTEQSEAALARTEALYRASRAMLQFGDLEALLHTIADETVAALDADRVLLLMVDGEAQEISHFVTSGSGARETMMSYEELEEGLSGWVMRHNEGLLSPKEEPDSRESEALQQRRVEQEGGAIMVVPLSYRETVFGTITAIKRPEQPNFTTEDLELLAALANQAAVAINNLGLLAQTQAQLAELTTLQTLTTQLSTAVTVEEAVESVLPLFVKAGKADMVSVYKIEDDYGIRLGTYPPPDPDRPAPVGERIALADYPQTRRVIRTRQAMAVPADDPILTRQSRENFKAMGITANTTIPIVGQQGDVWGIFTLGSRASEFVFSPEVVDLLRTMAEQASIAFERAEFFQRTQAALAAAADQAERLRLLNSYGAALTTAHTRDIIFRVLVVNTKDIVTHDHLSVALFDSTRSQFTLYLIDGVQDDYPPDTVLPAENSLLQAVIESRRMQHLEDLADNPAADARWLAAQGVADVLCTPLIAAGNLLGAMSIGRKSGEEFTQQDRSLFGQIASLLATTMEGQRLLAQAEARTARERRVRAVVDRVRRATNPEMVLQVAREEIGEMLGARQAIVRLGTQERLQTHVEPGNGKELEDGT